MRGSRSTGSRSIAFIRKIQTNTVSASGATSLRLLALWTMPLAWLSTISTRISTAAWKRPGTPEVALRAASHSSQQPSTPISDGEEQRVEVEDREVDHARLLAGLQMGQVVNDVFAGGRARALCALRLPCAQILVVLFVSPAGATTAPASYTCMHTTIADQQRRPAQGLHDLRRQHQHRRPRPPIFTISHNMKLTALAPGDTLLSPAASCRAPSRRPAPPPRRRRKAPTTHTARSPEDQPRQQATTSHPPRLAPQPPTRPAPGGAFPARPGPRPGQGLIAGLVLFVVPCSPDEFSVRAWHSSTICVQQSLEIIRANPRAPTECLRRCVQPQPHSACGTWTRRRRSGQGQVALRQAAKACRSAAPTRRPSSSSISAATGSASSAARAASRNSRRERRASTSSMPRAIS